MEQRRNKFAYDKDYYRNVSEQILNANGGSYLDGNAARKLYALPDYEEDEEEYAPVRPQRERRRREEEQRERRPVRQPEKKVRVKKVRNINFRHIFVLLLAVGALVYSSYSYLQAQSDQVQMDKQINALNTQLELLNDRNDALRADLSAAYDTDYVYAYAVSELGMVYPDKNQVYEYEKSQNGYVRQYGSIPD